MSKAKVPSRKYLGDRKDPHFIPNSPILSRQFLTAQQEAELTKSCEFVLSGVPTSDDNEDDLHRTTSNFPTKQTKYYEKDAASRSRYSVTASSEYNHKPHKNRRVHDDTATPSETSKRTTIDRTNTSTPLTMFSENLNRTSSSRQNNRLRTDFKSYKSQLNHQFAGSEQPRRRLTDAKSMACLRTSDPRTEKQFTDASISKPGHASISHLEFNKSLPSLPLISQVASEKQAAGFSRIFKPKKTRKVVVAINETQPTLQGSGNSLRSQTLPSVPDTKKNKFNLSSLFDRRKRQLPQQVLAV